MFLLDAPILRESSSPPFSAPFSRALLRANSCVWQLLVFCFPGSSPYPLGPSHKADARLGSSSPSLLCAPRKRGRKRRFQECLTYMLSGIALGLVWSPAA